MATYADSFGLQWAAFRATQYDSRLGVPRSAERLWRTTKWNPEDLAGRTVLEAGCGAGRFTEVLLGASTRVITLVMSAAARMACDQNAEKRPLLVFGSDILAPLWLRAASDTFSVMA
ncbi:MAG: hypothetical protein ING19_15185 [Azospirillum sp.]|nr:hypothetical protein [Azospirillum sp.]